MAHFHIKRKVAAIELFYFVRRALHWVTLVYKYDLFIYGLQFFIGFISHLFSANSVVNIEKGNSFAPHFGTIEQHLNCGLYCILFRWLMVQCHISGIGRQTDRCLHEWLLCSFSPFFQVSNILKRCPCMPETYYMHWG